MARSKLDGLGSPLVDAAGAGLLGRTVRRDLADLNLCYLELGLALPEQTDPLVAWSPAVRGEIAVADRPVLARMADCPFSLFEVCLPDGPLPPRSGSRVEDAGAAAPAVERPGRCVEFARTALFAAWRLADNDPFAARIVFGLSPAEQLLLHELCPTQVAALACDPAVVRARWPDRARFWAVLRSAAGSTAPGALQWVHCMGICLMDGRHGGARGEDIDIAPDRRRR
jgi:hypothetical protein